MFAMTAKTTSGFR